MLSPALEASFVAVVAINDGVLQEEAGNSSLAAWDAIAGRIPIMWTADALRAGIKKSTIMKNG